ncbi:MAG: Uma2 family endonuclease [Chromatiaceae bacterium]|jgi:Uma2 family endonuclease
MIALLEYPAIRNQATPLSVGSYHALRDMGLVPVKTELLDGVIVAKMTKSPLHTLIAHRLHRGLAATLPAGYQLRKEDPLTFADSEPEPDLAIVRGDIERFRSCHPSSAELVVEIAISSIDIDRAKAELYARAGVPSYWLVLPEQRAAIVYSDPGPGGYQSEQRLDPEGQLTTWYGASFQLGDLFR